MWQTALKLLVVYMLRNKMNQAKNGLQLDLTGIKDNIASIAERHVAQFVRDLSRDSKRIINSLIGLTIALFTLAGAGLIALIWLFAIAWQSVHREFILGGIIAGGLFISIGIFVYVYHSWQNAPFLNQTITQVEADWVVFKEGLKEDLENKED